MYYFGFDLGDGESCIHYSRDISAGNMNAIPVSGEESFISAVGTLNGDLVVGSHVQKNAQVVEHQHVCFKRHFLSGRPDIEQILVDFVRGVMDELRKNPEIGELADSPEEACFIVGCPAGWSTEQRERYRQVMIRGGMKNVRIASESRAAFENALRSRENAIDADLSSQTVLVIDIGSSTLDFAYIRDGNEYDVQTMGNVLLGGGLMDEMIVQRSLELQEKSDPELVQAIREKINTSDATRSRLMLEVREIKEQYFSKEDFFFNENKSLEKVARLFIDGKPMKVCLQISPDIVQNWLITRPHPLLNNQSFESRLRDSLKQVHGKVKSQKEPDLVILTGGASRMGFFRELCENEFSSSRIVISRTPEFDISRGLVFIGGVDENLKECVKEIREYVNGDAVENKVKEKYPDLIDAIGIPLTEGIMTQCVRDEFAKWRNAEYETLNEFEIRTKESVVAYLESERMQKDIGNKVEAWSRDILGEIELDLAEICRKYQIYMNFLQGSLHVIPEGGENLPKIRFNFIDMINNIVTIVMMVVTGMLCGGAGVALLTANVVGIIIGAVAALALAVGLRPQAEKIIKSMNIPALLRKAISVNSVVSEKNTAKVKTSICKEMLENQKMQEELVDQVSATIDQAITNQVNQVEKALT